MTRYIALLRAVNVGGTGKLPMGELRSMCVAAGFTRVQTYIASGNVVFDSASNADRAQSLLEARLHDYMGQPMNVAIRTAGELAAVLTANPFPTAVQSRVLAIFLDRAPPGDALAHARGRKSEEMHLGRKEIYVHYLDGISGSKLKIPAAVNGTARNMNTVEKLVQLSSEQ